MVLSSFLTTSGHAVCPSMDMPPYTITDPPPNLSCRGIVLPLAVTLTLVKCKNSEKTVRKKCQWPPHVKHCLF